MALRQTMRDFSDRPPVPGIADQRVVLLTGAGCSVAVGYPSTSATLKSLPEELWILLDRWFASAPPAKQRALRYDVEILLDEIFRLQNLALSVGDPKEFSRLLRSRDVGHSSEYRFKENLLDDDRGLYPAIFPVIVQSGAAKNFHAEHTDVVRSMLADVVQILLETYAEPTPEIVARSGTGLLPLLDGLRSLNPTKSLAIFTTNYDLSIERCVNVHMHPLRFADGMIDDVWKPSEAFSMSEGVISLFYLHGCCRWGIRLPEYRTLSTLEGGDQMVTWETGRRTAADPVVVRIRDYRFGVFANADSVHYPGMLFPSTVKRRYAHSPPFEFAYHQLLHALDSARVLAIVGQSGRDETIKEMLARALEKRRDLHVVMLDPAGFPIHYRGVVPPSSLSLLSPPQGLSAESAAAMVDACRQFAG